MSEERGRDTLESIAARVGELTRENERLFRELVATERRFRSVSRSVWRVQEEERRRLARELHDGIGQTLTALKNQLSPAASDARIGEALKMAAQALDETRELSRLLRPAVLDDLGLAAALSWLARTVRERFSMEVELDIRGLDERLDSEIETLAFRVVQEALTNVAKHAGAGGAKVEVELKAGRLAVRVSDQGPGFDARRALDPSRSPGSVGLRGMRDRAELFGGAFQVDSAPGRGTLIAIVVPLDGSPSEPTS